MITYVNSTNLSKYNALFDKASAALNLSDNDKILGLNDYFSYIEQLKQIDYHYAVLPLDEDVFEINANTRAIAIPKDFQSNGISVQGDEISEIVYFKINRYFDNMDLNDCDIYIQWENASDSNGVHESGVSKEWIRDIESEPEYLIFGWPISSEITKRAGSIKFAVRFFKFNNPNNLSEGLAYSFSTLTANVSVKPALDFEMNDDTVNNALDYQSLIITRLRNSEIIGDTTGAPPTFVVDLPESKTVAAETTATLEAEAKGLGAISYGWYYWNPIEAKKPVETAVFTSKDTSGTINWKQTSYTDATKPEGLVLYRKMSENSYVAYSGTIAQATADNIVLYERLAALVVSEPGVYAAWAQDRTGKNVISEKLQSNTTCVFLREPKVSEPVDAIQNNLAVGGSVSIESHIIADPALNDDENTGKGKEIINYQWYRKTADGTATAVTDGGKTANLSVVAPGRYEVKAWNALKGVSTEEVSGGTCRVTHAPAAPEFKIMSGTQTISTQANINSILKIEVTNLTVDNEDSSDAITYQWYFQTSEIEGQGEDEALPGETGQTFSPSSYGIYYVKVKNTLNGAEAITKSANIIVN